MRPKKGDRVEFEKGRNTYSGTVIGVSEVGVHFLIESKGGRRHRVGLSEIVQILGADDE